MNRLAVFSLISFMFFCALTGSTKQSAAQDFDYGVFAQIPVLHEGRVKPLDSFARFHLQHISGQKSFNDQNASAWLASVLFEPDSAATAPLFLLKNKSLKAQFNLDVKQNHFSLIEIRPALLSSAAQVQALIGSMQEQDITLTPAQEALLELHENALSFAGLASTFIAPSPDDETPQPQKITAQQLWEEMGDAYRAKDYEGWNEAVQKTKAHMLGLSPQTSAQKLTVEIVYNRLAPYRAAFLFYALALVAVMMIFKSPTFGYRAAQASMGLGILTHSAAIGARIYILERPPVGTLHESILFVSLICALTALIASLRSRNTVTLFAGSFAALLVLIIAPYLSPKGENLEMLVAVLNTNFWLATHVICITIGYGLCIFVACLAHGYLFLRARGAGKPTLTALHKTLYSGSLISLLFMTVGTILGGIWADQSWGRFWGWDPKENGALLIVLWLVWAHHGRMSGYFKPTGFAISLAALNVIVALSWFGVNLLNVGLHSYGFISGLASALFIFCTAQTIIIGGLWVWVYKREASADAR